MSKSAIETEGIPTVDLGDFHGSKRKKNSLIDTVSQGLHDIGFIFVRAPQIKKMVPGFNNIFRKVFDLPYGLKVRYRRKETGFQAGYTPHYEEVALECRRQGYREPELPDAKEGWFMGPSVADDDPRVGRYPLQYPPNLWPEEVPELKPAMHELYGMALDVGGQILKILEPYFNLERGYFAEMIEGGPSRLRVMHYPPLHDMEVGKIIWGCRHTDINLITVLPGGTKLPKGVNAGLWVERRDGKWIPSGVVPKDCVLVQVGDMLQGLTGGEFLSARHEVRAPDKAIKTGRISSACFIHPRPEWRMRPFRATDNPENYPTAYDDLKARLRAIGLAV